MTGSNLRRKPEKVPVTLIVGILCKDSVVMVADSQTTHGDLKIHDAVKLKVIRWATGRALIGQAKFADIANNAIESIQRQVNAQPQFQPDALPELAASVLRQ